MLTPTHTTQAPHLAVERDPETGHMVKRAFYAGRDARGAPWVHLVEAGGYGLGMSAKTAGVDEHLPGVRLLLESLRPKQDCLYLVNASLVAGEYTGFNARGDWFTEVGLRHEPPGWDRIPVWDVARRREAALYSEEVHHGGRNWGRISWGYPTWMNAHRFRHHVNHSPDHAYGYVLGAFWDDRMKRVVLVSELVRGMCEQRGALDVYERIQRGEYPDTSMGARVPYDRCSYCNHYARSPAEYCRHVNNRDPAFGMKKLLPDGRRCGVYNDFPRGFDDSFVFVGAEKAATVMADVTHRVRGSTDYTRMVPYARAESHPGVRLASDTWVSLTGGSVPVIGGGGRYGATALQYSVHDPQHEGTSFDQAILDAARATLEQSADTTDTLEARLTRYMNGLPADRPGRREQEFLLERAKRLREVSERRLSARNYHEWENRAADEIRALGGALADDLSLDQARLLQALKAWETGKKEASVERLRAVCSRPAEKVAETVNPALRAKLASLAKRAEMLKRLPRPDPGTVSAVRPHLDALPDLPTDALDTLARLGRPALTGMLQIGIILRPHEYGRFWSSMRGDGPTDDLAYPYDPLDGPPGDSCCDDEDPYVPRQLDDAHMERLLPILGALLGPSIRARSLLMPHPIQEPPTRRVLVVRLQIPPHHKQAADSYADYRAGVLAHIGLLGYSCREAAVGTDKVASTPLAWLAQIA